MRFTRTCITIAAPLLLLMGHAGPASAQMFITTGKDTLRGLPGVEIQVEPLEDDLERNGLKQAAIRSDIEQRLRGGGVIVYASQNENPSQAKPYVYIDVTGVRLAGQNVYAVALQVQLRQTLRSPVTSSNIVDAMTWDARTVLVVPGTDLSPVQATIREYVDHFIDDWRAAHR
jgi:hypothetical protein